VEAFDPATGVFTPLAGMRLPRAHHTATLLPDGRVLVTGGLHPKLKRDSSEKNSEIFDPGSDSEGWRIAGELTGTRVGHAATLLEDGSVLAVLGSFHDRLSERYLPKPRKVEKPRAEDLEQEPAPENLSNMTRDEAYRVLGLDPEKPHTLRDIKVAYRKIMLKVHPDHNQGNPQAAAMAPRVIHAYNMLTGGH
jgi:hypothetical protein